LCFESFGDYAILISYNLFCGWYQLWWTSKPSLFGTETWTVETQGADWLYISDARVQGFALMSNDLCTKLPHNLSYRGLWKHRVQTDYIFLMHECRGSLWWVMTYVRSSHTIYRTVDCGNAGCRLIIYFWCTSAGGCSDE